MEALPRGLPDPATVLGLAMAAGAFWTAIGWPLARRALPAGVPAWPAAPALGWAVQTAAAAVLLPWLGFGRVVVCTVALGCLVAAWAIARPGRTDRPDAPVTLVVLAGLAATVPALAILPKLRGGQPVLSAPIFDHSKIALVDAIARTGLPPADPFYGGADAGGGLAYYWWWHLGAAQLARVPGVSGWTADAALTGCTAAAALLLAGGVGVALAGRIGGLTAIALLLPGSLRWMAGPLERDGWLARATGLGGWLNQASWAPQHLAAGTGLVLSALLLAGLAEAPSLAGTFVLAAVLAADFGSSTWVGGITAGVALPIAWCALLWRVPGPARPRFAGLALLAAALALLAATPLLRDQCTASVSRHGGAPIGLAAYRVLGPGFGAAANMTAFPLLLLIEFPALALFGTAGVAGLPRPLAGWQSALLACGGGALLVTLALRSTIDNNDLGWRAVVPALLIAGPLAAAGALRLARRRSFWAFAGLALALLGLPGAARLVWEDLGAEPGPPDPAFWSSAAAFKALRSVSGPGDRVASNPLLAAGMTRWPANIAWAVLSDRPSCYAGWATAHAFAPVPTMRLYGTDRQVARVFAGVPMPGDVGDLAQRLHCRYALVLPEDGAWGRDPFAAAPDSYRLVASTGAWRIYRAVRP